MLTSSLDRLAAELAQNRRLGRLSNVDWRELQSQSEARAVQLAALEAYADDFVGYAFAGTSEISRRSLGLETPLYSAIPRRDQLENDCIFRLPDGVIGAQCELAFTLGRTYPDGDGQLDRQSAADAIVACQPAIGLLGRRSHPDRKVELTSVADFGLHVATICGRFAEGTDAERLDHSMMNAFIDGKPVIMATASSIFDHPLDAVVWLGRELSKQHRQLSAGDIVTTGSCAPILQVLPGQRLTVEFDLVGTASCQFS